MSTIPFGPPPSGGSNPLTVTSDPGVTRGSNIDAAPHEIPPGFGRYLQDVLLDQPGIVRQRGPLDGLNTGTNPDFPSLPTGARIVGMTTLADPNGTDSFRLLLITINKNTAAMEARIYGRGTTPAPQAWHARAFFEMMEPLDTSQRMQGDPFAYFDDRRSALLNIGSLLAGPISLGLTVQNSEVDPFFSSSLALDGGALVGIGMNFGADQGKANHRAMFHWKGAAKADYVAGGSVTISGTVNSKTVTGVNTTFQSSVEPGMFMIDTGTSRVLGIVASVQSNTSLTLEQNLLLTSFVNSTLIKFSSLRRPFTVPSMNVSAGSIQTSTTSAVVNGGGTKFLDQGVANGDLVFRESDFTLVGTVTSVQGNNQLTLTGNAAVAMTSEGYIIARAAPWAAGSEPVFSTYFNGMQLLANADNQRGGLTERSRIFVTETKNLEGIDLTKTGTFYDLPSTKPHTDIRGLQATDSAALVWLAEATYGLFGNTPDALTPKVIHNDGLLSPMSVQPFEGGAVWAGYRSVYFFDGTTVHDILEGKAQSAHQKALAGLDYSKLRCWSMLHNRHYVCFLQTVNGGVFDYQQGRQNSTTPGAVTFDPTSIIYAINMDTGALTFWTNVTVRGYAAPPGKLVNTRDAYFVVESATTGGPIICSAESLFASEGARGIVGDEFLTTPKVVDFAPHFYVETGLHTFGDPERSKRAQLVLVQYSLYGPTDTTKLGQDIVKGMGEDTKALSMKSRTATAITNAIAWTNKRSRFSTKSGLFGTRFYTMADGQPAAARLGPVSVGFKPLRPGRL
jgi:hypothetical protein